MKNLHLLEKYKKVFLLFGLCLNLVGAAPERPADLERQSGCELNDHLNELAKSNMKSSKGWVVDCDSGIWNPRDVSKNCINWFGWIFAGQLCSISTTMNGYGRAELDFGNCHTGGKVTAYIDGNEIGSASAQDGSKIVQFDFVDGSKLEIFDGLAIIQFNSLKIIECNSNIDTWITITGVTDKEFYISKKSSNFDEAIQICGNEGGEIFEPRDASITKKVTSYMQTAGIETFWLGIHDKAIDNTFVHVSDDSPIEWNDWADGQPNNHGGPQECAVVRNDWNGEWDDRPCNDQRSFVCIRNKYNWITITGVTDKEFYISKKSSNFDEAIRNCDNEGGEIFEPRVCIRNKRMNKMEQVPSK